MKTTVIVSDMQVPYHDPIAVANVVEFVGDFAPDQLVNVGDDLDSPQTSYWCKGKAGEYAGTLQRDIDRARTLHRRFREALGDKPYHISRSNHGDRTQKYIHQYAPALRDLDCLQLPELLGYNQLGMIYHREPWEVASGWWGCHGDEGTLSPIAGRTAALMAEKWGVSVVCGHTHRAGMISRSYGVAGRTTGQVTGVEVGHLMDMSQAGYLPGGHGDWQKAFAILYEANPGHVSPVIVPVDRHGGFTVEGEVYGHTANVPAGDNVAAA
jgi:hypothetical protein